MNITHTETDTLKMARLILPEGACQTDVDALAQRLALAVHRREIRRIRYPVTTTQTNPFSAEVYQATAYQMRLVLADCAEWASRNGCAIRPDLAALLEPSATKETVPPTVNYTTPQIELLNAAIKRFWSNHDPNEPDTWPTNEQVTDWLIERGVSKTKASAMASIMRSENIPSGRRPKG
jgi:hypothetical protein